MGNLQSVTPSFHSKKLLQEGNFIEYCRKIPKRLSLRLSHNPQINIYQWFIQKSNNPIVNILDGQNGINANISVLGFNGNGIDIPTSSQQINHRDFPIRGRDTYLMSSGVYCGNRIDHVLDGYSCAILVSVLNGEGEQNTIYVNVMPMNNESRLYEKERNGQNLKIGIFTGGIPWWQKIFCCGRLPSLLCGGLAVERNSTHQPIFSALHNSCLYTATLDYYSFQIRMNEGFMEMNENNGWSPQFPKDSYLCIHPNYDYHRKRLLTYTFAYSLSGNETKVVFYEIDDDNEGTVETVPYVINERIAMHMYGFTDNYLIVFANPLHIKKGGNCGILCGSGLLRQLDDEHNSDLIIHFIPRPGVKGRNPFIVDTRYQGSVYHAINCYESSENTIVIDVFISQLSASRDSAQFELDNVHEVYDQHGDPYRFIINIPQEGSDINVCNSKLIASLLDSTIDFHTINPHHAGKQHNYAWIANHERTRNDRGGTAKVESELFKIAWNTTELDFDPRRTVTHGRSSNDWNPDSSCYLRVPMYVSKMNPRSEDDGYIFVWSHELADLNPSSLLIFEATDLGKLMKIRMPGDHYIPYSIHSWIHPIDDPVES